MSSDFTIVTETGGEPVTQRQIDRLAQRYYWARDYCTDRIVIEVACGAGQGLGVLARTARSLQAGDITPGLVARAVSHYGDRVPVQVLDAQSMPFGDRSVDVVILFEAIYYLPSVERFLSECKRVLRPGGRLLIATANSDLFDFNPSPFSVRYYGVRELDSLLRSHGFSTEFFGGSPALKHDAIQRALRVVKRTAVRLRIIPGSMAGKRWLKRLVFGPLVPMPEELPADLPYVEPTPLARTEPDREHEILYCAATLQ